MDEEYDNADFLATSASVGRLTVPGNGASTSTTAGTTNKVVQPKPQALPTRQGPSAILVSTRQKGNPILNYVKSMPWEYSDTPCDYIVGATTCVLFLSLKYHRLHPEYIYTRIKALGKSYNLRILLTMVDIENHEQSLQELSKTSMINNLTLILAWSAQEAGRYLELFKSYEHASPASIRARQAESWQESLTEFVTTPRNINKTDAASLISNYGSLRAATNAQPEELALIPGWGEKKIRSWCTAVREPFRLKRAGRINASLLRQESSTMASVDATVSGNATPEQTGSASAISISRLPTSSRGNTRPGSAQDDADATKNHKRSRLDETNFGEDFDEFDEAELLAVEQTVKANTEAKESQNETGTMTSNSAPGKAREEPELSAGIAAALAKYRERG